MKRCTIQHLKYMDSNISPSKNILRLMTLKVEATPTTTVITLLQKNK